MSEIVQKYTNLLKPGRIGTMELRNRIAMAPMGTYLAGRDGMMTDRMKAYYEARARGGAALIIVEVASVDHPRGRGMTRQIAISEDKFMPGLAELAALIHKHGAKSAIQLHHGGRVAAPFLSGGNEAVSASAVSLIPKELGSTRALTVEEISELVKRFAQAAERAQKAGLDGVEIHAGHGYLIDNFLSRATNHRQDDYGGSLVNRARFLLDIITAIRGTVGKEYPVWCRIDGQEFATEDGITLEEAKEIARLAETVGIDAVHVSGYGGSQGVHFTDAPLVNIPGRLLPLAREIKQTVKIPVITAGRITPEIAEAAVQSGEADFIAMGRPLLADPDLPNKIARDAESEIRKCIYCYSCVHQIFVRSNICCAVNPLTGKESEPAAPPPERKKKVMVIGGGPAGMEAAIEAASRGHRVTLYEKSRELGGTLLLASIMRTENIDLVKGLIGRLNRSEVTVKLGENATPELVSQEGPDVLVLATGAAHQNPSIPGMDGKNVIDGNDLRYMLSGQHDGNASTRAAGKLTAAQKAVLYPGRSLLRPFLTPLALRRLTRFWMPLGKRIIILGGGLVGCELAQFLAERGRRVTVLESSDQIAPEMSLPMKWIVQEKLEQLQVSILTEVKYDFITPAGIEIILHNGNRQFVSGDDIIVACGSMADKAAVDAFQGKAAEVYAVGDCGKLSYLKDSIAEGYRIGASI